jgi:hypothetical protein
LSRESPSRVVRMLQTISYADSTSADCASEKGFARGRARHGLATTQRRFNGNGPFVSIMALPHQHHQARPGARRTREIAECRHRVCEEHRAKAADDHIELPGHEWMHLGIAQLVGDIAKSFGRGPLAGTLEQLFGDIHPKHLFASQGSAGTSREVFPAPHPMSSTQSVRRMPVAAQKRSLSRRSSAS